MLLVGYLIFLIVAGVFWNPHLIRAAFIRTYTTTNPIFFSDSVHFPVYEDESVLREVEVPLPRKGKSLDEVVPQVLTFLDTFYFERCGNVSVYIPGRPSSIARFCLEKGVRGTCYNDAILLNFMMQKMGFRARNVALDFTDGYGGSGHVVVEIWDPEKEKWVLMDAQNLSVFRDSITGELLSAFEIRKRLLSGDSSGILVSQYGNNWLYPAEKLRGYYFKEMPLLVLIRNSNFESVYVGNPFLQFTERLETLCGKPCFLAARFVRMLITGEERVIYMDERSPHLSFSFWRNVLLFLFYSFSVVFVIRMLSGALIFWRKGR